MTIIKKVVGIAVLVWFAILITLLILDIVRSIFNFLGEHTHTKNFSTIANALEKILHTKIVSSFIDITFSGSSRSCHYHHDSFSSGGSGRGGGSRGSSAGRKF